MSVSHNSLVNFLFEPSPVVLGLRLSQFSLHRITAPPIRTKSRNSPCRSNYITLERSPLCSVLRFALVMRRALNRSILLSQEPHPSTPTFPLGLRSAICPGIVGCLEGFSELSLRPHPHWTRRKKKRSKLGWANPVYNNSLQTFLVCLCTGTRTALKGSFPLELRSAICPGIGRCLETFSELSLNRNKACALSGGSWAFGPFSVLSRITPPLSLPKEFSLHRNKHAL